MITTTHTLKLPTGQEVTLTTAQLRELHTEIGKALDPEPKPRGLAENLKELTKQRDELWRDLPPGFYGKPRPVIPGDPPNTGTPPPLKPYCHGTDELFMRGMTTSVAPTLTVGSYNPNRNPPFTPGSVTGAFIGEARNLSAISPTPHNP